MPSSPPQIPSSFDPALFLQSEADRQYANQFSSHSDDFLALEEGIEETKAENIKNRVVIQYRAWNTPDVFCSEEDYPIDTPLRRQTNPQFSRLISDSSVSSIPSSPPTFRMPLASSPVVYPPSSSPQTVVQHKRKRSHIERSPLRDAQVNRPAKQAGPFQDDSEDDEEELALLKEAAAKRRQVSSLRDPNVEAEVRPLQPLRPAGPFQDESDDDEEITMLDEAAAKRRALSSLRDILPNADTVMSCTPPASQDTELPVSREETINMRSGLETGIDTPPEPPAASKWKRGLEARTASGKAFYIPKKLAAKPVSYEQLIAQRSTTKPGRAQKAYYGIDIHELIDEAVKADEEKAKAAAEAEEYSILETVEPTIETKSSKRNRTLMWTEKYRARKFTDLVGDERTHRSVLRWLKGWDPIVFPGSSRTKPKPAHKARDDQDEEQKHRKVLLLTGPPGLGKTTLAHVCARQAGYEVQEINASDERSRDVVKGRIRDMVGTENVRGSHTTTVNGKIRKAGKPVCIVVDEVDGVVSGSGGSGEGGFIKALIDLINLDEKNSRFSGSQDPNGPQKKKKGDRFRLLRPLILICNDVYHPSLRPLRQSSMAEIIHIRKPPLSMVISRMQSIFETEGIPCDTDGVRRLCEATWGVSTKKEGGTGSGTGEGDIRGIMVVGEWVAGKIRATRKPNSDCRLTRNWIEKNILGDLAHGGGAARSLGRGGAKDVVERVFKEGAGFSKTAEPISKSALGGFLGTTGVAELGKKRAMERLREMIDTTGDSDKIITDCFTTYPSQPYQDDTFLSKPSSAYEWLHFHDSLSSTLHGSQEWELYPYLSQSILAFHSLFASTKNLQALHNDTRNPADEDASPAPFSGPAAPYEASEKLKATKAQLFSFQGSLSIPLTRLFRSPGDIATELIPYVVRMLNPDVKPVIVNTSTSASSSTSGPKNIATASVRKASEKLLVTRAVAAMSATGVRFEKSRVEREDDPAHRHGGWVLRMEPPLDELARFETAGEKEERQRYAVRQVLESEWRKQSVRLGAEARLRRGGVGGLEEEDEPKNANGPVDIEIAGKENEKVLRDFFGRVIQRTDISSETGTGTDQSTTKHARGRSMGKSGGIGSGDHGRIWVTFHEGYSNAVRKPVTLDEFMRGL